MAALRDWPSLRLRDAAVQRRLEPRLARLRSRRPRLFCDDTALAAVRARIAAGGTVGETFEWLLDWARGEQFYQNLWAAPDQLIACSVAYRLSGREPEIARHAAVIADHLLAAAGDSWTWPRIAKALALHYDWLHADLAPARLRRVGEAALQAAKHCYSTWRHADFNNHLYLEYGPVLYVGLALRDEGIDDAAARQMLLDGMELMQAHFLPAHTQAGGGDGGWPEGMSYHAFFTYEFAHQIEALHSAGPDALWDDFTGLDGDAEWLVRCRRPFDGARVGVADTGDLDSIDRETAQYLPLLVRRRKDGLARWWVDTMRTEGRRRFLQDRDSAWTGSVWWPYVLWYDPTIPLRKPSDLPLAKHFRGMGWVATQSAWSREATFALFLCPPLHAGGHQHADYNSFLIHRQGRLAIDSGVYEDGSHRANYYARAIAHNTLLVFDPDERFPGGSWGSGDEGQGANDGGQKYTTGPERVQEVSDAFRFGKITHFASDAASTVVVGDATRAYAPRKLREFTRAFIHLQPDLFLVFDRVEATRPELAKTWLLHTVHEPRRRGRRYEATDGEGRLTVETLLPRGAKARLVGGPGREFETAGRNYPPRKAYAPDEAGRWRIEVQPGAASARDYFLHLLSTSPAGSTEAPVARVRETPGEVRVAVEYGARRWEVVFARRGALVPRVLRRAGGTP